MADLEISEDQPWMLQQLLQGTEFSSYSIAHEGHLILHCDTVACASNLRYANVGDHQVRLSPLACLGRGPWTLTSRVSSTRQPARLIC